jgi:hypothetical protein
LPSALVFLEQRIDLSGSSIRLIDDGSDIVIFGVIGLGDVLHFGYRSIEKVIETCGKKIDISKYDHHHGHYNKENKE